MEIKKLKILKIGVTGVIGELIVLLHSNLYPTYQSLSDNQGNLGNLGTRKKLIQTKNVRFWGSWGNLRTQIFFTTQIRVYVRTGLTGETEEFETLIKKILKIGVTGVIGELRFFHYHTNQSSCDTRAPKQKKPQNCHDPQVTNNYLNKDKLL